MFSKPSSLHFIPYGEISSQNALPQRAIISAIFERARFSQTPLQEPQMAVAFHPTLGDFLTLKCCT